VTSSPSRTWSVNRCSPDFSDKDWSCPSTSLNLLERSSAPNPKGRKITHRNSSSRRFCSATSSVGAPKIVSNPATRERRSLIFPLTAAVSCKWVWSGNHFERRVVNELRISHRWWRWHPGWPSKDRMPPRLRLRHRRGFRHPQERLLPRPSSRLVDVNADQATRSC
jgi:hypothetical protein